MERDLMLDGNAVGGLLGEIFATEPTSATARCGGCGATGALGGLHAFVHGPGVVIRCPGCDAVLLRVVRGAGQCWVDFSGLRWVCFASPDG
ncbi:MAG: DUF6510 family protein [Acidimicrobiales bacterium]